MVRDVLDSLKRAGFRRVLIVNGHGGNSPARAWRRSGWPTIPTPVKFHNWWNAPKTWAKVQEIDPSRAMRRGWRISRGRGCRASGSRRRRKPMVDLDRMRTMPAQVRAYLGDGNYGGYHQRSDNEMLAIWDVARRGNAAH